MRRRACARRAQRMPSGAQPAGHSRGGLAWPFHRRRRHRVLDEQRRAVGARRRRRCARSGGAAGNAANPVAHARCSLARRRRRRRRRCCAARRAGALPVGLRGRAVAGCGERAVCARRRRRRLRSRAGAGGGAAGRGRRGGLVCAARRAAVLRGACPPYTGVSSAADAPPSASVCVQAGQRHLAAQLPAAFAAAPHAPPLPSGGSPLTHFLELFLEALRSDSPTLATAVRPPAP